MGRLISKLQPYVRGVIPRAIRCVTQLFLLCSIKFRRGSKEDIFSIRCNFTWLLKASPISGLDLRFAMTFKPISAHRDTLFAMFRTFWVGATKFNWPNRAVSTGSRVFVVSAFKIEHLGRFIFFVFSHANFISCDRIEHHERASERRCPWFLMFHCSLSQESLVEALRSSSNEITLDEDVIRASRGLQLSDNISKQGIYI